MNITQTITNATEIQEKKQDYKIVKDVFIRIEMLLGLPLINGMANWVTWFKDDAMEQEEKELYNDIITMSQEIQSFPTICKRVNDFIENNYINNKDKPRDSNRRAAMLSYLHVILASQADWSKLEYA